MPVARREVISGIPRNFPPCCSDTQNKGGAVVAPQALFVWWAADRSRFKPVFRYIYIERDTHKWMDALWGSGDYWCTLFRNPRLHMRLQGSMREIFKNTPFGSSLIFPSKIPIPQRDPARKETQCQLWDNQWEQCGAPLLFPCDACGGPHAVRGWNYRGQWLYIQLSIYTFFRKFQEFHVYMLV